MSKNKPGKQASHASTGQMKAITPEKRQKIDQRRQAAMERAIGAFVLALFSGGEE